MGKKGRVVSKRVNLSDSTKTPNTKITIMMQNTEVNSYFLFIALVLGNEHKNIYVAIFEKERRREIKICAYL